MGFDCNNNTKQKEKKTSENKKHKTKNSYKEKKINCFL
jgi:hypothetical protein